MAGLLSGVVARLTSRSWCCDPYLSRIADQVVRAPTSVVQLVRNSEVWRGRYSRNVRDLQHNPIWKVAIRGLNAALHRFDSWQKPFSRVVLTFDAFLTTAQQLHDERRNAAPGRHSKSFLQLVDEEVALSLGLMADAGEESLALVRFLDSEHCDKSELSAECKRFLERISALFERQGCLAATGCYTNHMLAVLARPRCVYIDGVPKRIGGGAPAPEVVARCLARMCGWVRLCKEILAAEFPQFELMQAFSCFRLTHMAERRTSDAESERLALQEKLTKLAHILKLDVNCLSAEFYDHLPIAQYEFELGPAGTSSFAAWRAAVTKARGRSRKRLAHPSDTLVKVLVRMASWGVSTSGVEQSFAALRAVVTAQRRGSLTEASMRDEAFILSTKGQSPADDKLLAEGAAKIWTGLYGPPREAGGVRRRGARRHCPGGNDGTLKAGQSGWSK